jgi:hypothetical protein
LATGIRLSSTGNGFLVAGSWLPVDSAKGLAIMGTMSNATPARVTSATLTDERIEKLLREASDAGDVQMVKTCERALRTRDERALRVIAEAINDAAAQA